LDTGCFEDLICFISRHPFCGADLYFVAAWEWEKNGMERRQLVIEAE
jgi:hypothetical protein